MSSEQAFCPYTGLRPFTEDESIYFKGRDVHIDQATQQLERNKFIIITGASGDGKSSLVYAGIIPNAKAGFLKASYSNWIVADFRPERSPMKNLSRSLANALDLNVNTVQTELNYGFSALVDMYKASTYYLDPNSAEQHDRTANRKAANLVILADQFEEFFTNPENFHLGVPSQESVSVTNILLETARIALTEQLPIYVIMTMRSDYIGQCAAFRGLPGYIGFSQFFLPRLNRRELREVIEEPAVLNGNAISRRLTERLIYDIEDGSDQLPILQHALNQIWKMADNGAVEMDLIHYAKVGGIGANELQTDGAAEFRGWFETLPQKVKDCYHSPNLKNVLNTHANKLYQLAWDSLPDKDRQILTEEQTRRIISYTFKCLTKIDNTRAVRNRMTLNDIWRIIDMPGVSVEVIGRTLTIFREPGNTLLRPFTDNVHDLRPDDILDITHESLIRNWDKLNEWAAEEFASYTISRDFETQLNRWLEQKQSTDFLLSIGGLTYFEGWLKTQKFNAPWIARYLKEDDVHRRNQEANAIEDNSQKFLKASTKKHRLTRTLLHYSNRKTGIVLGLIALLTLTSFVARNYYERQNKQVLQEMMTDVFADIRKYNVNAVTRSQLAIEALRLGQATLPHLVNSLDDLSERIKFSIAMETVIAYQGRGKPADILLQSILLTDSLLESLPKEERSPVKIAQRLKNISDFGEGLEIAYVYLPNEKINEIRHKNAARGGQYALDVLRMQPAGLADIPAINLNLERAVSYKALSVKDTEEAIALMSPINGKQSGWIAENYNANKVSRIGFYGGFTHNGLYQQLGYLYASQGDAKKALQCIDSLLEYNDPYFQDTYSSNADNASHIAQAFYINNQTTALDEFVNGYCKRAGVTSDNFYALLLARCKLYEFATVVTPMLPNYDFRLNLSLEYSDSTQLHFFFEKYREAVLENIQQSDPKNFTLALSYKDEAILNVRLLEISSKTDQIKKHDVLFDKAMLHYSLVSEDYLNQHIDIPELSHYARISVKRKFLFIFPDVRTPFHPNEPRLYHFFYTSQAFLKYMLERNIFDKLYSDASDIAYLNIYLRDYLYVESYLMYTLSRDIDYDVLVNLEKKISARNDRNIPALPILYMYLGRGASQKNDKEAALSYYNHIASTDIRAMLVSGFDPSLPVRLMARCLADMAQYEDSKLVDKLVSAFDLPENRVALYSYASQLLSLQHVEKGPDKLIADAEKELVNVRSGNRGSMDFRSIVVYAELVHEQQPNITAAYDMIKNIEVKYIAFYLIGRGVAFHGDLYDAYNTLPDDVSDSESVTLLTGVYRGFNDFLNTPNSSWADYHESHQSALDLPIYYASETD
ncbi:hypothetical protein WBG78_10630 [Chryseolinea sp. T2]|uniref:nSTAND1 domain-containing NTPase n=1 Tax=Chryseolinea sp. T2 TaxID=3129255 RepID=UPI003077C4AB